MKRLKSSMTSFVSSGLLDIAASSVCSFTSARSASNVNGVVAASSWNREWTYSFFSKRESIAFYIVLSGKLNFPK